MYEELNIEAKEFLTELVDKKTNDKELRDRCYKEINILYEREILYLIEYLYKFKEENKFTSFIFKGTINNMYLLYLLGLSNIDPIKYNLPYELCNTKKIKVEIINNDSESVALFLDKKGIDFKIFKVPNFEEDPEIRKLSENIYIIIPSMVPPHDLDFDMKFIINDHFMMELESIQKEYFDFYMTIQLNEKLLLLEKNVDIKNVINNEFEEDLCKLLNPVTIDDYVKIKSIARGVHLYKNNEEKYIEEKSINISNLIANKEDILEYLLNHNIDKDTSFEIIKLIDKNIKPDSSYTWNKYINLMKENKCDEYFIDIITNVIKVSNRADAINECLYVLDKNNYLEEIS